MIVASEDWGGLEGSLGKGTNMQRFEDLPRNHQALILAKLALEMTAQNAPSIHHLAKARQTDVPGVWRGICRKAGQPVCTVPTQAMDEQRI
jgi:NAD-dependent oxidoreductase involved in siderophore biosynthesis